MEDFNKYMEEFKSYSLDDKRKTALEQLKVILSLTDTMCEELGVDSEMIITKDAVEAQNNITSDDDFVEGVVVYASSIQNSLCKFTEKLTEILEKNSN